MIGLGSLILLIGILTYESESNFDKFTKVKVEKIFDFGSISKTDTVKHIYKITNLTNTILVIDKILPSCTCTVSKINTKICKKN